MRTLVFAILTFWGFSLAGEGKRAIETDTWSIPLHWRAFSIDSGEGEFDTFDSSTKMVPDFELDFALVTNAADPQFREQVAEYDQTLAVYIDEDAADAVIMAENSASFKFSSSTISTGLLVHKAPIDISDYERVIFVTRGNTHRITLDESLDLLDVESIGLYATQGGVIEVLNNQHSTTIVTYEGRSTIVFTGQQQKFVSLGGDEGGVVIGELGASVRDVITSQQPSLSKSCSAALNVGNQNIIYGSSGPDTLVGTSLNDNIRGNNGNDYLYGMNGNDIVQGDYGDDPHVNGNTGSDAVYGGVGRDYVYGGQDNDTVDGGADQDYVYGDLGCDTCYRGFFNYCEIQTYPD